MAEFDLVVDTKEMARSIDTVNVSVVGTTAAVVKMQSDVIEAQNLASRNICNKVDTGFYMLLQSQITQKIAAVSSKMASSLLLMKRYKQDIERIKGVMQDDYYRIYRRYKRQFSSLNSNLLSRIHALDRVALEIETTYKSFFCKANTASATAIVTKDETELVGIKAGTAKLKDRVNKTFSTIFSSLSTTASYNNQIKSILNQTPSPSDKVHYIPCIITNFQSIYDKDLTTNKVYSPNGMQGQEVENATSSSPLKWKAMPSDEKEKIKLAFKEKVKSEELPERVKEEILKLFNLSSCECTTN